MIVKIDLTKVGFVSAVTPKGTPVLVIKESELEIYKEKKTLVLFAFRNENKISSTLKNVVLITEKIPANSTVRGEIVGSVIEKIDSSLQKNDAEAEKEIKPVDFDDLPF